jgi:uncharacterized protein (DUF488 family)
MQMKNQAPPASSSSQARIFSVGHSDHPLPALVELLRRAGVTAVADVRSQPYSGRMPQFNRPELERGLRAAGITYAFLGDLLGGRPQQPSLFDAEGRVDYHRVRSTDFFRQGLDRLCAVAEKSPVAMLCAEEDPLDCHRALMIAPALVERGIYPIHLRKDGSQETTAALEGRLLMETKVDDGAMEGLFAAVLTVEDRRQMLAEAYDIMARRKAFRMRPKETDR